MSENKDQKEKLPKTPKTVDLTEFSEEEVPQQKRHSWVGTVVLLLIIGLGIFFMTKLAAEVSDEELRSLGHVLANLDVKYTLISFGVLFAVLVLEALKFAFISKATTNKFLPLISTKVALLGKYYDDITPFGTGGQPMQIYYLHKKGFSGGVSTAIVMIKYFVHMICWLAICLVLMAFNSDALRTYVTDNFSRNYLLIAGWIGWGINILLPLSVILCALLPKITNKILNFFIGLVTKISWSFVSRKEKKTGKTLLRKKIKILRRQKKWKKSAEKSVREFRASFIVMSKKPLIFICLILCCLGEQLLTWAFPYFLLIAFANGSVQPGLEIMLAIMTLNVFTTMSVSFIPTPGNSGVIENVMLLALKILAGATFFWVVFSWRLFTYYIYIIIGLEITVFELIRSLVRKRKNG